MARGSKRATSGEMPLGRARQTPLDSVDHPATMLMTLLVVFDALQLLGRQAVETLLHLRRVQAVVVGERRCLHRARSLVARRRRKIWRLFADFLFDRL